MRCLSSALVVCPLLALLPAAFAAAEPDLNRETPVPAMETIPVGDFFRPALLSEPRLNPSGTHIAAVVTTGDDHYQLLVYELKTKKVDGLSMPGDRDVSSVTWLNDKRMIFQLSARKMYGVGLMATEVGALNETYPLLQYYYSSVLAVPPGNRLRPLVWNRYDGLEAGARHDLGVAVVNTDMKQGKLVDLLTAAASMSQVDFVREHNQRTILRTYPAPSDGVTTGYIANLAGELEFAFTYEEGRGTMHRLAGDRWEKCSVDLDEIDVLGTGDEPGQLVVLGPREEGKPRAVQYLDGATGQLGEVLLRDADYDFYGGGISHGWLYREPVNHHIIGAVYERHGPQVQWFSETYRALQKVLNGFFPGLVVRIIGSDEAQKLFLVATFSDRQPAVYNWVDLETRTVGLIKRSMPWIEPARMQPMNLVKFKTRDGKRLDAYLTLPAGASKANPPPLVVLCHGGPWARDTWGFDGEVQFLASRGYAVLQPNYRGSTGTQWMFPAADKWEFVKMHEDVTEATKAMIASGLVDRDRIAIMGTSFGGYLAISGVVREPSLYRCAVTNAGVFDWAQQVQDKKYDQYETGTYGYFIRRLGDPKRDPERFERISPGRHVDQIRVPVFVAGGKDDQIVEISQSKTLVANLRKHNVPHETYFVSEEGHGMRHIRAQVELYSRIEAFLAKNLLPKRDAAGTPAATAAPAAKAP
jgi:dipeptidyl aminopeptidase/acylaminoacyl peptidase